MDKAVRKADGTPWGTLFSLMGAVLYGVSPIDIIPDVILVLGWMDDAVAIPTFLMFAWVLYARHRKNARLQPQPVHAGEVEVMSGEPRIPSSYEEAARR